MEVLQIAKMTTKHKCTVLSIEDTITICEHLDKGSSKREITCEYKITVFVYFMYICLIIQTFYYLNKSWFQWGQIIKGALYSLVEKYLVFFLYFKICTAAFYNNLYLECY